MSNNGPAATDGLAEVSHGWQEGGKEIRDGDMGEGQWLSEEDESQINEDDGGMNDECGEVVEAVSQRSKQQSQRPLVCWKKFLPLQSLKVLLVENDDSTRHVVSALLRNSGYEVTVASDALQAWKLLEDLTNHFDLVLTEVVMPCLTGFGLLCKIKRHKTLRNIPVITMSSHCSMSVVFKCLSKGAVDFLVKPIRKNELKNLWQHVWRKCHSATGSGSENVVQAQKSTKSADLSNHKTSSNGEDDNGSIGVNLRDGSDHGSGTQSCWTKRVVEVDSLKSMSPWNQLADHPDCTSSPVIQSTEQAYVNNWVPGITTKECKHQEHELDNSVMGKDLEIGMPGVPNLQLEEPSEKEFTKVDGNNREKFPEMNLDKDDDRIEVQLELNSDKYIGELRNQAADLRGVITNSTAHAENTMLCMANGASNVSNTKAGVIYETKEMPSLKLSLKRVRDVGEMETSAHDRNVLRHSDLSAFSRYNSSTTSNQGPTGNVGSCSPFDNSSEPEAVKVVSMQNVQSSSNSTPPNQGSNGSSNNDMGSTTKNAFTKVVAFIDKPAPKSAAKTRNPISAFQSVQNGHAPSPQHTAQGKSDTEATKTGLAQDRTNEQVQVQHHHHHYHHHHHHVHKTPQEKVSDNDLPLKNMVPAAPQCGSSNKLCTPLEDNSSNLYLNGSASGSDHGSNGANGCNTVLTLRGTNMESDNGAAKCELGSVIGFGRTPGVNQNCHSLREAALNKFRHKRKERCFEKKASNFDLLSNIV